MTAERPGSRWQPASPGLHEMSLSGRDRGNEPRSLSAPRSRPVLLTVVGSGVGALMVASMMVGSTALQLIASLVALAVAVLSPPAGLIALAFAAPLARPLVVPLPGIFVLMAAAMLFGILLRLPIERPRLRRPPAVLVVLGIFVCYAAAQVVAGRLFGYGGPINDSVVPLMARLMEALAILGVAYLVLRGRSPYPVLAALLLSALVASTVALAQVTGAESVFEGLIHDNEIVGRITGTFDDPNYFGVYLAMMIALALALGVSASSWRLRALLAAVAFPLVISLLYTQSRGALLALMAGVVTLAFARSVRTGLITSAALMLVAVVAYPVFVEWRFGDDLAAGELSARALTSGRSEAWFAALDLVAVSPVFGIGFGRFRDEASVDIGAHNWYVQVLAELGVVGIALWIMFVLAVVLALRARARSARCVGYSALAVWLAGGFSLAPPTSFEITGGLLVIVAAALVADWASGRPEPVPSQIATVAATPSRHRRAWIEAPDPARSRS